MLKNSKLIIVTMIFLITLCSTSVVQAMTIVLDPGHGGQDPGAVNGSTYESDVNLKIARYIKEYLEEYEGVEVILTHNGLSSGELTIFERSMIARNKKADLLVSIHTNSSETSEGNGAEIYVSANTSQEKYNKKTTELANRILKNLSSIGIANRGVLTKLIPTDTTDVYSDGTRADYMGIIRYAMRGTMIDDGIVTVLQNGEKVEVPASTSANVQNGEGIPTILVEHCFIKGNDYKYIDSDEDIKKLAKADLEAIVEQYGLKLKSDEENPKEPENKPNTPEEVKETDIEINEKDKEIKITPSITLKHLQKKIETTKYYIIDSEGKTLDKEKEILATGYKLKVNNKTYTIIKMGDVTGDGKAIAVDGLAILKHKLKKIELEELYLKAADTTNDGTISSADSLAIIKDSIGTSMIHL